MQESQLLTLSEDECHALPSQLQELDDRLCEFCFELSDEPEDVDVLDQVAALQLSLRQALEALTALPSPPAACAKGTLRHQITSLV
jgi:hypothetical protein